jgi:hypothetical protein
MAMTKAERAEMERLQNDVKLARAARFQYAFDVDITPDVDGRANGPVAGWLPYLSTGFLERDKVGPCFVSGAVHYKGDRTNAANKHCTWSHGCIDVHSTRLRALQALRQRVEREMIRRLKDVDDMIAAEVSNPTPALQPVKR